ncbi:MAG: 50S ribosomal protein L3 [Candidatus Paceibacterota bacterium]
MAKFLLGEKIGMTQVFEDDGTVVPVTVVKIGPNVVVQLKTLEKDGYEAIQVGAGSKKKITKSLKGHLKDLGNLRFLKEFRTLKINEQEVKRGDKIDVSIFVPGDVVKVTGLSKGKGFAGVMKRHGFSGMPHSHGHHHVARHGGSIGQRFPQHTLKGMRMAGRTGGVKKTTRGLKVVRVDVENGFLALRGAVPGNNGGFLIIQNY